MRFFLLFLCSIILLFACGSDEIPEPAETKPNYFPDTIGSRWVYRNSDGLQWTWLVTSDKTIDDINYRFLENTPVMVGTEFDYLIPTFNRISENQILLNVGEKIDHYIQTELPTLVQDEFAGLDVKVAVEPIPYPELLFFQIPLTSNFQWDALNVTVSGNLILQDLTLLQIPFEGHFNIKGEVIGEVPLDTPAGRFENTFQVKYKTEIVQTVFSNEESTIHDQTIWFVPHVGIVKIEDEHGEMELIEYTLESPTEA